MFTPVTSNILMQTKTVGEVSFIENSKGNMYERYKYRLAYKYQNAGKTLVRIPLCKCEVILSKNAFYCDNLKFDDRAQK